MKIAIGADHGGFDVKEALREALTARGMTVEDLGCHDTDSVDYPDFAAAVGERVSDGRADQGVLVCTTGIGMSMAANKFPRVRAALCVTPDMAEKAREHNDANVLVLGASLTPPPQALAVLDRWLEASFSSADRHARRVRKIGNGADAAVQTASLFETDPDTWAAVRAEMERQQSTLDLIASENHVSAAVREAQGSVLTNKYAEGYPGKRWYQGCRDVDTVERLAIERACRLFAADHANVQPHCGSAANMGVYFAALDAGDTILAMNLAHGGHLTHGHSVNFSGRFYNVVHYGVSKDSERIEEDEVRALALKHRPKLIVAGASAYPRTLDFAMFRRVADEVGAMLMTDMAHIAGLVAAGVHPSPVPHSEFVTTTTHKTLRGPRSGMILCREALGAEVDRQIFPGVQGGPQMHAVAAKAVCFHEAMQPSFREYAAGVVRNAAVLAADLQAAGLRLVAGGTDNHLMLVDLTSINLTGREAAQALEQAGIVVNKNAIPFDTQSPFVTSGIRLGTPAVTTRGLGEAEMHKLAGWIIDVIRHPQDETRLQRIRGEVNALAAAFPAP